MEKTPEQLQFERRVDHFARKKNIYRLKENVLEASERLARAMKEEGVTSRDLQMGMVSENIRNLYDDYEKTRQIAVGSVGYHIRKAQETGELKKIAQDFEQEEKVAQIKSDYAQKITEAKDNYEKHPTKENLAEVIKHTMHEKAEREHNTDKPGLNSGLNALRDRLFNEAVAEKKKNLEIMKAKGIKPEDTYDRSSCNPYKNAFEDATSQVARGEEPTNLESAE